MASEFAPTCPICQSQFAAGSDGTYRPFCSKRCQVIDLGNWLGERYTIPTNEPPEPSAVGNQAGDEADAS